MNGPALAPPLFLPRPHRMAPEILREYDMRGRYGDTLDEADAAALGAAFGTHIRRAGGSLVCVGYDGRASSPALAEALLGGLLSTGITVESVGRGPTPLLHFAVKDRLADGGIMVTGSHNPPGDNGFKLTLQDGPFFSTAIRDLAACAAAGDFDRGEGVLRESAVTDRYIDRLLRDFEGLRPLKVAWDCGNGATGDIVRAVTARLPGTHAVLYDTVDPAFPHHHPDPTVDANLADLIRTVRAEGCDLGVAFDGDGDRIGVVDETGAVLRCDTLLALYARDVLEDRTGAPVVADVKCSQILFDEIARLGGDPVMARSGHALVKDRMIALKAPLGGELSGHIFFADKWYGFDDGVYAALRLLALLGESDGSLSALTAALPATHNTPEIRCPVPDGAAFDLVARIADDLDSSADPDWRIDRLDGVRVTTPEGWWLLRPSNTESVLVARAESATPEGLEKMKRLLATEVEKTGYALVFPT